ncbi:unnamed protein product [Allacma fusca]|uniref:Signal recognition particle 19 kDa protein n=1 Tax=Allacma fusca TaxID=39272 RepID=A0A8J2KG96_9HEXA|nr:unnamed protein product [Allacma fusca]
MATPWIEQKKHSDKERWVCIYPAYLNSKKTRAEGRRIPLDKAVENPAFQEVREVLSNAGFNIGIENKAYSREKSHEPHLRGRLRIQFRNDDGSLVKPEFPTRESVMIYCGERIPKLKSRTQKDSKAQGDAAPGPAQGGGKKKGKKK